MCTFILSDKTDVDTGSTYLCLLKSSHFEDKIFVLRWNIKSEGRMPVILETRHFYLCKILSLKKEWKFVRNLSGYSPAGFYLLKGREHENMVWPESQGETKLAKWGWQRTQPKQKNQENNKQWRFKLTSYCLGLGCEYNIQQIYLSHPPHPEICVWKR